MSHARRTMDLLRRLQTPVNKQTLDAVRETDALLSELETISRRIDEIQKRAHELGRLT